MVVSRRRYLPWYYRDNFSGRAFSTIRRLTLWTLGRWLVLWWRLGVAVRASQRFTASHTSGRNTEGQVADSLNTTGMYSIVRNPLYLGNFLMILGVVLFLRIWWIPALYATLFALYYERIIFAEEMFLRDKFGQDYLAWASKTPAFFPKFALWKPTASFSGKDRCREYPAAWDL